MSKKTPIYSRNEDQALFLLIKKRDREAFTILYYFYFTKLRKYDFFFDI